MKFLSRHAWLFLRPTLKQASIIFICSIVIASTIGTQVYAGNNIKELSKLLKSEFGLEVSEDRLINLSSSKQTEIISLLSTIERGRTMFLGKTPAENALGVLTKLIEREIDKSVWDIVLNSLFKLTQTPVEKAKDIADKSTEIFLIAATIKAMPAVPRERLVFDYIQNYRIKGKNDENAWKEMLNKYNGIADLRGGCNINALITGDGDCQRIITLQRGGESLHSYAQLAYESFNLANQLNNNPQQKESLKQQILKDIEEANNTEKQKPGLFSRIWETITKPFKFLGGKVKALFTKKDTNTQLLAQISKSISDNSEKTVEPKSQPSIQWKTIDKTLFSVKIPKDWEEIPSKLEKYYSQVFKFGESSTGNFFSIGVDPVAAGGDQVDEFWHIKSNGTGDGVIINKIEEMVYQDIFDDNKKISMRGDSKLDITAAEEWSKGIRPITIKNHNYDFFFGNSKKEIGVDTGVFREILLSFRAKKQNSTETQTQGQVSALTQKQNITPKSQPPAADNEKASMSILVVDQFNKPVEGAKIWFEDERGKTYSNNGWPNYWNTDKAGRLNFFYDASSNNMSGKYTIHIEKKNYSPTQEGINVIDSPTAMVISPDKFVLRKRGAITGLVVNEAGDPVYQAKFWLTDQKGQYMGEYIAGMATDVTRNTTKAGRLETVFVPDGQYTLNITCGLNCMFGDEFANNTVNDIYAEWSKTLKVEVAGSEVWLDKIVLTRKK